MRTSAWPSTSYFFIACGAGLVFFWSSPGFHDGRDALPGLAGAALLVGMRLAVLPLGRLARVQTLRLFDPAVAGFDSWAGRPVRRRTSC